MNTYELALVLNGKLEEEAKRVIGSLPAFIPGKQRGEAVVVSYSLPILFQIY